MGGLKSQKVAPHFPGHSREDEWSLRESPRSEGPRKLRAGLDNKSPIPQGASTPGGPAGSAQCRPGARDASGGSARPSPHKRVWMVLRSPMKGAAWGQDEGERLGKVAPRLGRCHSPAPAAGRGEGQMLRARGPRGPGSPPWQPLGSKAREWSDDRQKGGEFRVDRFHKLPGCRCIDRCE